MPEDEISELAVDVLPQRMKVEVYAPAAPREAELGCVPVWAWNPAMSAVL